jgi:PAS domain S-box-containing protein
MLVSYKPMQSQIDYKELFEWVPLPLLEVNAAGWLLQANRAACDLLGFSRDELQTLQLFELLDPTEAEDFLRHFAELLHGVRSPKPFEWQFRTRLGAILSTEVHAAPLLSPHGSPRGMRLAIIDLAPR